ncbi:enoyl-CoA hydratase [Virgibacillus soli]|uniref:Enoyl-CoA hydratase n=1 Tax=Paracerasibacillus soli TaxID=480284 RepID=A0ABU5CPF8_9BACI|nr:enoyl-CoA hydratase [Virgibacillus soli]MDY0408242.1 enoyl-CoA hydratase [Virgibacillus soli]
MTEALLKNHLDKGAKILHVTWELIHEHIGCITINRPEVANALSQAVLNELQTIIKEIDNHPQVYCTIITGAGEKAFCAGADLKERRGMSDKEVVKAVTRIGETVTMLEQMSMPTIAALNGVAFGGGLELALACDIRIANEHIKMGLTETSLAIIPGAGGTQRLPRLIGLGKAKELIFTAKAIRAEEALSIGLVQYTTDDVMKKSLILADKIIRNGPVALRQAKLAINSGAETDLNTGLQLEHLAYKETIPTKDRIEALEAFKEKRKPNYKGQ